MIMKESCCLSFLKAVCFGGLCHLLQGDWAESYAALGRNSSTSSRGFRVQVEKAKLEEVSSENLRSFERSPVASRDPQGSASRSFSTESPQGSQSFQHDGSELVRWKSFCDLKRVWWKGRVCQDARDADQWGFYASNNPLEQRKIKEHWEDL